MIIRLSKVLGRLQHNTDRVSATNGILSLLEVVVEGRWVETGNCVHPTLVEVCDLLVDHSPAARVVWCVSESVAPMAEVGRYDEDVLGVGNIPSKYLSIRDLATRAQRADEHWDDFEAAERATFHDLSNEWHLHLETVLGLLVSQPHPFECVRAHEFIVHLRVHDQITERSSVFATGGQCAPRQEDNM